MKTRSWGWGAAALLLAAAAAADQGSDVLNVRRVEVSGEGVVTAPLDMAVLRVAAEAEGARTAQAQKAVADKVARVLAALEKLGIKAPDAQTVQYQVSPRWTPEAPGRPPRRDGYQVTCGLRVKVKALDKLGEVFDAVLAAGADRVEGSSFDVADRTKPLDQARAKALEDAARKAAQMAEKAGARLGDVLLVSEEPVFEPQPFHGGFRALAASAEDAAAFPVSPGETDIRVRVRAVYALR